MSFRLPIQGNRFATLISVYAPNLLADAEVKEAFYSDLRNLLWQVKSEDKVLILGDFNVRVGQDCNVWTGVLGRHGNCNDNGCLLLEFCSEHELTITNTMFQQKDRYKTTWQLPQSKHWHLLDYILTRQRDINDVQHTRVMPSADCYTNHRLICSKVAFTFKPLLRKKGPQTRRLSVQKLRCPLHQKTYQTKLAERLDRVADPDTDIDHHWTQLKTVLQETTAEVAGFSSRKHKDWFDESDTEIQKLLEMKRSSHQRLMTNPDNNSLKAAYRTACNTLQKRLHVMKND